MHTLAPSRSLETLLRELQGPPSSDPPSFSTLAPTRVAVSWRVCPVRRLLPPSSWASSMEAGCSIEGVTACSLPLVSVLDCRARDECSLFAMWEGGALPWYSEGHCSHQLPDVELVSTPPSLHPAWDSQNHQDSGSRAHARAVVLYLLQEPNCSQPRPHLPHGSAIHR